MTLSLIYSCIHHERNYFSCVYSPKLISSFGSRALIVYGDIFTFFSYIEMIITKKNTSSRNSRAEKKRFVYTTKNAFFVSENHQAIDMTGHGDTCVESLRLAKNGERNWMILSSFITSLHMTQICNCISGS